MNIKSKKLVGKDSLVYEYVIKCTKCGKEKKLTIPEKNEIELSSMRCECEPKVVVPKPEPKVEPKPVHHHKPEPVHHKPVHHNHKGK